MFYLFRNQVLGRSLGKGEASRPESGEDTRWRRGPGGGIGKGGRDKPLDGFGVWDGGWRRPCHRERQPAAVCSGAAALRRGSGGGQAQELRGVGARFWDSKVEKFRSLPNWTNFGNFRNFGPNFSWVDQSNNLNFHRILTKIWWILTEFFNRTQQHIFFREIVLK